MSSANTVKDASGNWYALLADADGNLYTRQAKQSGHPSNQVSATGNIKASAGVLYDLIIAYAGVTAGDTVVIKDGIAGAEKVRAVLPAANGTLPIQLSGPMTFASAIYATITISGGTCHVTGVYD